MGVGPTRVVDLGHGGKDARGAVGAERNAVGLPDAPQRLAFAAAVVHGAVVEFKNPLLRSSLQFGKLLVEDHLVDLGADGVGRRSHVDRRKEATAEQHQEIATLTWRVQKNQRSLLNHIDLWGQF